MITNDAHVRELAQRYRFASRLVTTARGYSYATAREAALKLMETSYCRAQAFSGADLLHGPLAMIDPQVPVLTVVGPGVGGEAMQQVLPRLAESGRRRVLRRVAAAVQAARRCRAAGRRQRGALTAARDHPVPAARPAPGRGPGWRSGCPTGPEEGHRDPLRHPTSGAPASTVGDAGTRVGSGPQLEGELGLPFVQVGDLDRVGVVPLGPADPGCDPAGVSSWSNSETLDPRPRPADPAVACIRLSGWPWWRTVT